MGFPFMIFFALYAPAFDIKTLWMHVRKKIDFPSQITITFLGDIKYFKSKEETTQKFRTKKQPLRKTVGKINVA